MKQLLDPTFFCGVQPTLRDCYRARELIADGGNVLLFSAVSGWEIVIKAGLGKPQVPEDLGRFLTEQLFWNDIWVLPIHLSPCIGRQITTRTPLISSWFPRPYWKICLR